MPFFLPDHITFNITFPKHLLLRTMCGDGQPSPSYPKTSHEYRTFMSVGAEALPVTNTTRQIYMCEEKKKVEKASWVHTLSVPKGHE
jgi:hypothetical protein